jgi:hypothetical protein
MASVRLGYLGEHALPETAHLNQDGTCTDFVEREDKPNGRTVGRIYKDDSAGEQWFWCVTDRAPSPAADRGFAPTRAKATLFLKQRWIEPRPLKPGEMQMGRSKWMNNHPTYKDVVE